MKDNNYHDEKIINKEDDEKSSKASDNLNSNNYGFNNHDDSRADINVEDANPNNGDDNIHHDTEEDKQLSILRAKIVALQQENLRSHADLQNLQKRMQDEVKKTREYAVTSFAKDIIVIKDYLEMALKDNSSNVETIKMGVDLTLKQLIQVFERQMIKEVKANKTDKLDPHLHQAINTIATNEQEPNTIINIMQKGYTLHERVLRPAMVTVAKSEI